MNVGEFISACASNASGGILPDSFMVLGIDMSENQNADIDSFTAVTENVTAAGFDLSPATAVRKYVDGHRSIAQSDMKCAEIKFIASGSDSILKEILSRCAKGKLLRCAVVMPALGIKEICMMRIRTVRTEKSGVYGSEIFVKLSS